MWACNVIQLKQPHGTQAILNCIVEGSSIDQGPERFLSELTETTSRALGQQRDSDEMEGTKREATTKGKEWEALVLEENNHLSLCKWWLEQWKPSTRAMGRPAEGGLQLDMVSQLSDVTIGRGETSRGRRIIGWNGSLKHGGDQVRWQPRWSLRSRWCRGSPESWVCSMGKGLRDFFQPFRIPTVAMPSKAKALKDRAAYSHLCSRPWLWGEAAQ